MPTADFKFVEAYRAAHPVQAHALRLALEEAGIQVFIENEALQGAIGEAPFGWSSAPRLMVDESQLAAARAIIQQTDHSERADVRLTSGETAVALLAGTLGMAGVVLVPTVSGSSEQIESTACLSCGTVMAESESTCPTCGWSYSTTEGLEPVDEPIEDW